MPHITGRKKQSEEGSALFVVRVKVIVRALLLFSIALAERYFTALKLDIRFKHTFQNDFIRMLRQKHKLGERIFKDYDLGYGYRKTKEMHQKTFDRLHKRYWQYEMAIDDQLSKYLG